MPITNKQRMKARRDNWTPEQLAAARKKSRDRMRALRAKRKAAPPPAPPLTPAELKRKESNDRLVRLSGCPLADGEGIMAFLDNRYANMDTVRCYLANLVGAVRDDPDFPQDVLEMYRKKMLRLIDLIRQAYGSNTKSARDKKNWIDWPDLITAKEKCDATGTLYERAIFSLYMDSPPRRGDHRFLRLLKGAPPGADLTDRLTPPDGGVFTAGNFVVVDDDDNIVCVTLADYKTAKKYGRQTLHGDRFGDALKEYCKTLATGQHLFKKTHRGASAWSQYVATVIKRYAGKRATVNTLRKSYVTHLANTRPEMTTNEKKQVAADMGTSLAMFESVYRKVD